MAEWVGMNTSCARVMLRTSPIKSRGGARAGHTFGEAVMANAPASLVEHIRQLASAGTAGGLPDEELLRRYVQGRDKVAFGVLLRRHGPMVWNAARRFLHQA